MSDHPVSAAAETAAQHEHHNDNFRFMGREFAIPVYTGVFIILAILTVLEIALFELPRGFFTIPVMVGLSIIKAGLVVWFYMHLNKDSRVFLACLIAPTIMVVLATIFLSLVPGGGY